MNNKSDYLRTLMLTTWEIYMHRKGEKKGQTTERKSKEQWEEVCSERKNRVSRELFTRERSIAGTHVSIVHNKCHSNDARGFYEEPAIVSLDLHEIDKNMEHLAFEPSRTAPAIGSIAVLF